MNTPGTKQLIVVGDTDELIAILSKEDANHEKAVAVATKLLQLDAQTVFPITSITETVTTLKRKLNKPTAKKLNTKVIFSTDNWYTKLGFELAESLLT